MEILDSNNLTVDINVNGIPIQLARFEVDGTKLNCEEQAIRKEKDAIKKQISYNLSHKLSLTDGYAIKANAKFENSKSGQVYGPGFCEVVEWGYLCK
jgi:hypothetical protein